MPIKIKICGITSLADGCMATQAGADYLGFIINYQKSPRHMEPTQVKLIVAQLHAEFPALKFVGVFVDRDEVTIKNIVNEIGLDVVQLHGVETPAMCEQLKKSVEVWKTIIIKTEEDLNAVPAYRAAATKIIFDAGRGNGKPIDLTLLAGQKVDVLAGGLNSENVSAAMAAAKPEIVDFNSGVESAPGKKDVNKIRAVITAVYSKK